MAGGFLMGLGQGLQRAAGTVGEYAENRENKRRFDLSQELAEKARRDQNNRWGVEDQNTQFRNALAEKNDLADEAFRKNQYGMELMRMDYAGQNADRQYELEKQRNASYDIMARNQGARNAPYDRYLEEQRLVQAMGPLRDELKVLEGKAIIPSMVTKQDAARMEYIRMILDRYQQQLQRSLVPNVEPIALNSALGGGADALSTPKPEPLLPRGGVNPYLTGRQ